MLGRFDMAERALGTGSMCKFEKESRRWLSDIGVAEQETRIIYLFIFDTYNYFINF